MLNSSPSLDSKRNVQHQFRSHDVVSTNADGYQGTAPYFEVRFLLPLVSVIRLCNLLTAYLGKLFSSASSLSAYLPSYLLRLTNIIPSYTLLV